PRNNRSTRARNGSFHDITNRFRGYHHRGCSMIAILPVFYAQVNGPPTSPWSTYVWFMIIAIGLIALMACIFLSKYFNLWIQAKMTQANVSIWELVGMSFRK